MNRKERRKAGASGGGSPPPPPAELQQILRQAVGHHQAGRLNEAWTAYQKVLSAAPDQPDALHFSGILLSQSGKARQGIERLQRAASLQPNRAEFHGNLGQALAQAGQAEQAEAAFRRAIELQPKLPDAHNNLGNLLRARGDDAGAEASFRAAIDADPNFAGAWNNLGNLLADTGRTGEAIDALRKATGQAPDFAGAHSNLGGLLSDNGDFADAETHLQHALELAPDLREAHEHLGTLYQRMRRYGDAARQFTRALKAGADDPAIHINLAECHRQVGDLARAEEHARKAVAAMPDRIEAALALGVVLRARNNLSEAEAVLRAALETNPRHAGVMAALAWTLDGQGRLSEAASLYESSIEARPGHANTLSNLGVSLVNAGRIEEGLDAYRAALDADPASARTGSNLLMAQNYRPTPHDDVMAAHRAWADRHARPARFDFSDRDKTPDRPIRIGVASPDLRTHSIAFFFETLLSDIDQARYPVTCYAQVRRPDGVTERLKGMASGWVDTIPLGDDELADRIHDDGIDILLDLAGHTRGNRLPALSTRPAPVQVLWLGAPDTSGLDAVDYRVTDPVADPPGKTEHWHTEKLVRIAGGLNCYAPDPTAPEPATSRSGDGPVMFGSFNNWSKAGPETLDMWADVLDRVADSRLLLKAHALADPATAERVLAAFEDRGIEPARITIRAWEADTGHHLALYNDCDIALDTRPYAGHTTTCEAIWMGTPVITCTGDRMGANVSASILTQVGEPGLVAATPDEFTAIAEDLASDRARREELHGNLRARMAGSALCDSARFARAFEAAFRTMWQRWCAGDAPDHFTVGD